MNAQMNKEEKSPFPTHYCMQLFKEFVLLREELIICNSSMSFKEIFTFQNSMPLEHRDSRIKVANTDLFCFRVKRSFVSSPGILTRLLALGPHRADSDHEMVRREQ